MKSLVNCLLLLISWEALSQKNVNGNIALNDYVFEARFVQLPPLYPFGTDSCKRFYFTHFKGFDSILTKAVANGDTAKYLRVYFSFDIDRNGAAYNTRFEKVASTRYAKTLRAKTISYFFEASNYYEEAVKQMISKMPLWKPALQNGIPVACRMEDYIQFWVGLIPPS